MTNSPTPAPNPDDRHPPSVSSSRLKKREADRKAQRIAREKTKNRIAHLESLVEELSKKDDNATTVSLMTQLSRAMEQRNKLMSCLEATSGLFARHLSEAKEWEGKEVRGEEAKSCLPASEPSESNLDFLVTPAPEVPVSDTSREPATDVLATYDANGTSMMMDGDTMNFTQFWMDDTHLSQLQPQLESPSPASPPKPPPVESSTSSLLCPCATSTLSRRLSDGTLVPRNAWKAGNEILREPFAVGDGMLTTEYQVSEDIPVHAVLHGWDSLAQSDRMTPLWKKVRQLDELCFAGCGQTERLGVLFMIHLLMRAYADPTPVKDAVVPRWYLKSQLQSISHDPSADYFTWPALRYRFATTPHRYCHNSFWHFFREHLRIVWPFDFRDCYVRNVQLGAYGLSPLFKDRILDLRAWTMEPDFFVQFPELWQDIPKFPGQPSPIDISQAISSPCGDLSETYGNTDAPSRNGKAKEAGRLVGDYGGNLLLENADNEGHSAVLFFQDAILNTPYTRQDVDHPGRLKDSLCISL